MIIKKKTSKKGMWVGIGMGVAAIIAVAIWIFWSPYLNGFNDLLISSVSVPRQ